MIECNSLSYSYAKEIVLDNLNWHISDGKVYGLLGKNGSGKTTLLHCLCGLLGPKEGAITVNGQRPRDKGAQFKSDIFLVPESFYLPSLSLMQLERFYDVAYTQFDSLLFHKILEEFELKDVSHWRYLSFGQRKKLLIALGISSQTRVLLMDEPTNGLDIPAKAQFNKVLSQLISPERIVVISTHHVRDIQLLLDQVTILDQGQVVLDQSTEDICAVIDFSTDHEAPKDSIYTERTPAGYKFLRARSEEPEKPIDVELFYQAYHHSSEKLLAQF